MLLRTLRGILQPSALTTRCPYKGIASYDSVVIEGRTWPDLVWSYRAPIPECAKIAGLVSFYNEKVDEIRVDGKTVPRPQTKWS